MNANTNTSLKDDADGADELLVLICGIRREDILLRDMGGMDGWMLTYSYQLPCVQYWVN